MRVEFWGAAQTVTGSKHLVVTDTEKKILLDCGLFQGMGKESFELNQFFGFNPSDISYVLLSHAHIDHSGLLPKLVAEGFKGKIYATDATIDLCKIMLLDSAFIQENDLLRINKRRKQKDLPPIEPLYTVEDATKCLELFEELPIHKHIQLDDEVSVYFTESGHILGSVAVNLTLKGKDRDITLMFTGDIGRINDKILNAPEAFPQADYIICESTYGNRMHEPQIDMENKLLNIVRETCVERSGKVIIPAFSIDRTQELIYALDKLSFEGKLPHIKVYVDSPLSVKATEIMNKNREWFNKEIIEYISKDGDPFCFPNLYYVQNVEESKAINAEKTPSIIISASGMAEAGRIKHHIANNIENKNNTILIVGYASPDSLAGHLRAGEQEVRIFGDYYKVKARVEIMDNFSAHADYIEMLNYLECQDVSKVRKVFLVHGEQEAMQSFEVKLKGLGFQNVVTPEMGDSIELT